MSDTHDAAQRRRNRDTHDIEDASRSETDDVMQAQQIEIRMVRHRNHPEMAKS
jgi:hypothetical protein